MHPAAWITLWHLLVNDSASRGHPLNVSCVYDAAASDAVAVLDASREDVCDGLDSSVGMPRESRLVILRTFIPEVVEQEERVELGRVAEAERPAQIHTCAFAGWLGHDEPLYWPKRH